MTVDDRPVISRQRLADQVYAVLRGQILARELVPGDHLSVPVLAESLGLSRSPVREAVQRLVVEGLAVEEFHRGARVAGVDADDLADVYAVRGVLEGLAAALVAEPARRRPAGGAARLHRRPRRGHQGRGRAGDHRRRPGLPPGRPRRRRQRAPHARARPAARPRPGGDAVGRPLAVAAQGAHRAPRDPGRHPRRGRRRRGGSGVRPRAGGAHPAPGTRLSVSPGQRTTSKRAIMPWSSWSSMWQWIMNGPV